MSESIMKRIDARFEVLDALAHKGSLNMWSIKKEKNMHYSTVHKAVNSLKKDGLIESLKTVKSQKGGRTEMFRLTFRGFIMYLACSEGFNRLSSLDKNQNNLLMDYRAFSDYQHCAVDPREQLKKMHAEKRAKFLDDVKDMAEVIERNGKLLDYPLFTECRVLEKHFGISLYFNFCDIARLNYVFSPLGMDTVKLKALKKLKQPYLYQSQAFYEAEDELSRRVFGEQFFQRIVMSTRVKVSNKNLRAFAESLKKKREDEIKYLGAAIDLFS